MRTLWVVGLLALVAPAWAGKREADDLKRQIDVQRTGIGDLERLDEKRSAVDELALLKSWVDEATNQHTKEEFDRVREVLDRVTAQAELIRQRITASKASAVAADREAALKRSKEKVERTKAAIQQATINKKALEMNTK
jgi:hypothetical protein